MGRAQAISTLIKVVLSSEFQPGHRRSALNSDYIECFYDIFRSGLTHDLTTLANSLMVAENFFSTNWLIGSSRLLTDFLPKSIALSQIFSKTTLSSRTCRWTT